MYEESFLKKVQMFGVLKYPARKIFILVSADNIEMLQFKKDFETPGSEIYNAYQYGVNSGEFAMDQKLFSLAKDGDIDAMERMDKIREDATYLENCKEIFG